MTPREHPSLLHKKGRLNQLEIVTLLQGGSEKKVVLVKTRVPASWSKKIQEKADLMAMGNVSEFLRYAIYQQIK